MSELGDIADRAARREAEFLEDALQRQRRASASPRQSAIECQRCGSAIPEARRQAVPGVQTCIDCQTTIEQQQKGKR